MGFIQKPVLGLMGFSHPTTIVVHNHCWGGAVGYIYFKHPFFQQLLKKYFQIASLDEKFFLIKYLCEKEIRFLEPYLRVRDTNRIDPRVICMCRKSWVLMQSLRCHMFSHVGAKLLRLGGGRLRSKVTKSLRKLFHVGRELSVHEGQEETLMWWPSYHELFPGGYKVNPSDLANSVSLTRLPHCNLLNITAKKSVWCLAFPDVNQSCDSL